MNQVILTSSMVAIIGDNIDMRNQELSILTEEQFNTTSSLKHQPYAYSKVEAEKNVGIPMKLDASKSIEKLKLSYIPLDQTVKDMIDQIASSKD